MRIFLKILKWTGIVLFFLVIGLYITIEIRKNRTFKAPYPQIHASKDSAIIAKGKGLVFGPAHCANCHAPVEMEEEVNKGIEAPLSGGLEFKIPIGTIYAKNLTPDETGIGKMTDPEIARALRYGLRANGTALFDFMPFHNTSDEDITAIISYLRAQAPVKHEVPENDLNLIGKAVKAFLIEPVWPDGEVPAAVKKDTSAAYGKYLAGSIANCRGCHTARDLMTGAFTGPEYAGGLKMDYKTDSGTYSLTTPNLTTDKTGRIKGWTQEQFIARFRRGKVYSESHMPWGPFSRMSDEELKAIYNFLQTLKPIHNEVAVGPVKEK
jgi:mono/diheme cytochrome c family protein